MFEHNSNLKIAFISPISFFPAQNGGHRVLYNLCTSLAKVSDVYCITTDDFPRQNHFNFSIKRLLPSSFFRYFSPRAAFRLYLFLRKTDISVCFLNQPFIGFVCFLACAFNRTKIILYAHNIEYKRFHSLGKWWFPLVYILERIIFRWSDLVCFISIDELNYAESNSLIKSGCGIFLPHIIESQTNVKRTSDPSELVLFFVADFSYTANRTALENILTHILSALEKSPSIEYKLRICGRSLPPYLVALMNNTRNAEYLGYVDDLAVEYGKVDVLLNPVLGGGGVQTKTLESIAAGVTVISSMSAARGIPPGICGHKLITVRDQDWEGYAAAINN